MYCYCVLYTIVLSKSRLRALRILVCVPVWEERNQQYSSPPICKTVTWFHTGEASCGHVLVVDPCCVHPCCSYLSDPA